MNTTNVLYPAHQWGKEIEYVMPRDVYNDLCTKAPLNVNKRDWVIKYINETFGLLGVVTVLHVDGESVRGLRRATGIIDDSIF